ncbi:MAG: glycine--tRNA ligase subunit beta [Sneathiellaceae bacterium]
MAELLLEALAEEMPARMQAEAAAALERLVRERLAAQGLAFDGIAGFVTPRRLALQVTGLPLEQAGRSEERRGPRADAPEKAIAGFLRSAGLDSIDQCERRETPKGVFLYAVQEIPGRPVRDILAELLPDALAALPWPKSMRWGDTELRWVRPLQSILALLDGRPVRFAFGHLHSGTETRGHRFMAADSFAVEGFADYREKLRAAHVMLDPAERRAAIATAAAAAAAAEGLAVAEDPGLLAETAGLVEWPVVLLGGFDPAFLEIPREVLVTSMRSHQKYFALNDSQGRLQPRFVIVSNMAATDGGARIVAGNERVLRARLSDARFFWDQDRKVRLADRVPALDGIVYHAKLGSLGEKVARMRALAAQLAPQVPGADPAACDRAALLAKADLTSEMVGEFPELQGVMGRYYARHDGEDEAVAEAVAQHYAPQGPSDGCPTAPVAVVTALADKLDTLACFFRIGEKPTGSRDPFSLRRAALGIIRIVLENGLRLPLRPLLGPAADEVLGYMADRLVVHLRDDGVRHDLIAAAMAPADGTAGEGRDDFLLLSRRVQALVDLLQSDDGANLLAAYRRAANIVAIEEKRDGRSFDGAPDAARYAAAEEAALGEALAEAGRTASRALEAEDFAAACAILAGLRQPVDAFFDRVTVNAEDAALRENRLRLLRRIRGTLDAVADFSQVEG